MENRNFYLKARKENDYGIDVHNWLKVISYEVERGGRYKLVVKTRGEELVLNLKANHAFNVDFAEGWPPKDLISWPTFRLIMEGRKIGS